MRDLTSLMSPERVVVIGASNNPVKVGYSVLNNLKNTFYTQKQTRNSLFAVNPKSEEILGLPTVKSVKKINEKIDMAVICVPAANTPCVLEECGDQGVKSAIIITAGFREIGTEGLKLEQEIQQIANRYNLIYQGPNCLGLLSTSPSINASFSRYIPPQGKIGFISQSGAFLTAVLDWSQLSGLGFSKLISLGNKSNLDETDFLHYLGSDQHTSCILGYLEDIKQGADFIRIAQEIDKPIVILKSGQSDAGKRAASSHTGSLAGNNMAYNLAFKKAGILQARDIEQLFSLAKAFTTQPYPTGRNLGLITNAGGPGIWTTDYASTVSVSIDPLLPETIKELEKYFPREASLINPVDILGTANATDYENALKVVAQDKSIHGLLALMSPQDMTEPLKTSDFIIKLSKKTNKPIFVAMMGGPTFNDSIKLLDSNGIPVFHFPENAVKTFSGMASFYLSRSKLREKQELRFNDVRPEVVKKIFNSVKADNRVVLLGSETSACSIAYGIPTQETYLVTNATEAGTIADRIGYPVVMKIASPDIIHKTDVGGVQLGLKTKKEVEEAYQHMIVNVRNYLPNARIYGTELQKMSSGGFLELFLGMTRDPVFGPLIAFGIGGIFVEIMKDIAFGLAPLDKDSLKQLVMEPKGYQLIKGARGKSGYYQEGIEEAIARLSQLAVDFPEIVEIDVNPLFAYQKEVKAIDVKMTLGG